MTRPSLTNATANAGGTVHYQVFDNPQCAGTATDAGMATVTNGVPGNSIAITFNLAGKFYWQADYSGDANNDSATSPCSLEVVTVDKNIPDITTTASGTVQVGGSISDTAHLSGGFNPTGTILFVLYGPNDATCALTARRCKAFLCRLHADTLNEERRLSDLHEFLGLSPVILLKLGLGSHARLLTMSDLPLRKGSKGPVSVPG